MEELRKLEQLQVIFSSMKPHGLVSSSSSSDDDSARFIANLVLLMVQPCGELDVDEKCSLISKFMPKITGAFLKDISSSLMPEDGIEINNSGFQQNYAKKHVLDKVDHSPLQRNYEDVAVIELDAMQRANSTLEDFCRSYFMFHGLDVNNLQLIFKYLPVLSFTESFIYQVDTLNERIVQATASRLHGLREENEREMSHGWIDKFKTMFESDPFRPLARLLESNGLLTERIRQEFRFGEEYWKLERKLCRALADKQEISVDDVMRAIHLKSFDYRVLNLLLYQLRREEVNDLHMEFLSISEFLVEVSDDLFDYEDDVLENNFNILRMFVRIFGPADAPARLAKYITEAEEQYESFLKTLDSELSANYQKRCEEATNEGGKISGHPLGTWNIPPVIVDEESYRANYASDP